MRRASALIAALSVLAPAAALAAFRDVPAGHPYAEAIAFVQERGIVGGYPDGTYKPDRTINRAEFTKILTVAAFGQPAIDAGIAGYLDTHGFSDVPEGAWFADYVLFAWQNGIVAGNPDGTFRPEAGINFAEAAKIIVKSFSLPHTPDTGTWWWEPYVNALGARGALPVTFRSPEQQVTRGEMAAMIMAVYDGQDRMVPISSSSTASSSSSSVADEEPNGAYVPYVEGVIGNGSESILYFYAAWCPYCQANDARMRDWYGSNPYAVTVYKVDYDTAADLKQRYGVAVQDTFIRIDGTGREIDRTSFPQEDALREFLQ